MIPKTLAGWSIPIITDLLTKGYHETDEFDFKEMLPHKSDKQGKQRLLKTCCAFANSGGGFLVYGIKDDAALHPTDRIVGIDPTLDFPEQFGNYPLQCEPSVGWEFLNPPLAVGNGNVIHIVYLPRSWKAPHSTLDLDRPIWRCFPKRTNKGDEEMSFEEIRMAFLQFYEKRLKLQLLRAELETIRDHHISETGESGEFSLMVLETTLADTYTLLVDQPLLLDVLTRIRENCRAVNRRLQLLPTLYSTAVPQRDTKIHDAQMFLREMRNQVYQNSNQALKLLENVLEA